MATIELKPQWLDCGDIRQLHADHVRLGLQVSLTGRRGFFGPTFMFSGEPENLAVWEKVLREWHAENQSKLAW